MTGTAPRGARRLLLCAAALLLCTPAAAQPPPPDPPGPYVIDIRGATSGLPAAAAFYPDLDAGVSIPGRGFGFDVGAHVYVMRLGPSRVGLGINVVYVRGTASTPPASTTTPASSSSASTSTSSSSTTASEGTTTGVPASFPDVVATARLVAPQVSFNFGTRDGWSYLGVGLGVGQVRTNANGVTMSSQDSGMVRSLNVGGGARWFLSPRLAVGFDVRMHRLSAGTASGSEAGTPGATLVAASFGVSVR